MQESTVNNTTDTLWRKWHTSLICCVLYVDVLIPVTSHLSVGNFVKLWPEETFNLAIWRSGETTKLNPTNV